MPHRETLFSGKLLTDIQEANSRLNLAEMCENKQVLKSMFRRLILELTNACNMNCKMCGRNTADFKASYLPLEIVSYFRPFLSVIEEVTLMGWGEPTIHPMFKEILEMLDQYNVRKYFLTNGLSLNELIEVIFKYRVDLLGVSVNGATPETNDAVRLGSSLEDILKSLREITAIKKARSLSYPYIGLVMCLQRSNLYEFLDLIDLAADIGINRCKAVYLTAFGGDLVKEVLWGWEHDVFKVFEMARKKAALNGIDLDLPSISGSDPAGYKNHNDCTVCWRDLFVGSDSCIRPCMSFNEHFIKLDTSRDIFELWNSPEYQRLRACVNEDGKMPHCCSRCFQSSFTNWNHKESFLPDMNGKITPDWEG